MYYFFMNDELLPVPPPKMNVKIKNKNKTINLINEGEINVIKNQGLQEVSFEVLLPNSWYPFSNYGGIGNIINSITGAEQSMKYAKSFVDGFDSLKVTQTPFRLIIVRMSPKFEFLGDTNLLVTLEDYAINEDAAGDGFDFKVPLKFKQYRPYGTKELVIQEDENGNKTATIPKTRETTREIPRAYKTAVTMSALEVCRMVSGGQLDWRAVANNNQLANPNSIPSGTAIDFWR